MKKAAYKGCSDWWQSRKLQKEAIHTEEIVINLNWRNLFKIALF